MELKKVKMIDLLLKLKYRRIEENIIYTVNDNLFIDIQFLKNQNQTEIGIYEDVHSIANIMGSVRYDRIHFQLVDGNLIPLFTVVSNIDYIKNRLKVEI